MFRSQYFEAIDVCLAELNRRFDEKSHAPLQQLEEALLNAANREPFEFNDNLRKTYGNRIDFDQATAELKFLVIFMHVCTYKAFLSLALICRRHRRRLLSVIAHE